MVYFSEFRMSAILKKGYILICLNVRILGKRGVYIDFPISRQPSWILQVNFHLAKVSVLWKKGSLLCSGESVFCIKGVPFMSQKVSILKKRGIFFYQKVSGKGSLLNLENDHMSPLLQPSGRTGHDSSVCSSVKFGNRGTSGEKRAH